MYIVHVHVASQARAKFSGDIRNYELKLTDALQTWYLSSHLRVEDLVLDLTLTR